MRAAPLLVLFCLASPAFAADPGLAAKVDGLAKSYVDWGPNTSSQGASLSFQEISRSGNKRVYHVLVSGLPREGTYAMLQWPVTMASPQVVRNPVFVHATGVLLCVKDGDVNSSDDTVNLTLESVRGEPARMGVVSIQDPNIRALGKITPRPIESVDGGCRLSATYLTPRGEVVFVEASGLAAGEAFTMTLHSGSKDAKQQGKASPSGGYAASFLPVDPKASSGKGLAELRLRAPSCSPSLDFVWGDLTGQ